MVISPLNNFSRQWLIGSMVVLTGCSEASTCSSINDSFSIYHWQGGTPKSVLVHVMKRGADQEIRAPLVYRPTLSHSDAGRVGNILTLEPETPAKPELSASDDYSIVIDNRLEYHVHDIEMTDRANLGCPIRSAMVNECRLGQSGYLDFESDCSRTVHPTDPAGR